MSRGSRGRRPPRASVGQARLGTHLCSTRASADSRLKERTAPLLKPQKKVGCVGWKATARGASAGDMKSYSCGEGHVRADGGAPRASLPRGLEPRAPNPGRTQGPPAGPQYGLRLPDRPPSRRPSGHTSPAAGSPSPRRAQCGPGTQWPAVPGCARWQGPALGGVGAHQHVILLGRDIQEAQVTRGRGGQHTQAAGADADRGDWPLVLCRQGAW